MAYLADIQRRPLGHVLMATLMSIALVIFSAGSWARAVLDLSSPAKRVELLDWGDYWIDPSGSLSVDDVQKQAKWQPTRSTSFYELEAGHALWLRFSVPAVPETDRWYVALPDPSLRRATLFGRAIDGGWSSQSAGVLIPVGRWPVPHRYPLLPVTVSAESPLQYFMKIENARAFHAEPTFVSDSTFTQREHRASLLLGMYFGLACLAAGTALINARIQRDAAQAFTAIAILAFAVWQFAFTGLGGMHLWPQFAGWNEFSSDSLCYIAVGASVWAYSAISSMAERSRAFGRYLAALTVLAVPLAATTPVVPATVRPWLVLAYSCAGLFACTLALWWAARRGDRHAPALLAASVPVLAGVAMHVGGRLGWSRDEFLAVHALQIGTVLQWPILLLLLMLRGERRRENRRRIQGLDRVDPATGLVNDYEFSQRLTRVIARAERMKYRSAVMLVDVVNAQELHREYDGEAEDLALLVAGRLISTTREIDTVARLGESRFGVLVEGPFVPGQECQMGARIVAHCLRPYRGKPTGWMPKIHVAQGVVWSAGQTATAVVAQLSELLGTASPDSRRTVFTLAASSSAPSDAAPLAPSVVQIGGTQNE